LGKIREYCLLLTLRHQCFSRLLQTTLYRLFLAFFCLLNRHDYNTDLGNHSMECHEEGVKCNGISQCLENGHPDYEVHVHFDCLNN